MRKPLFCSGAKNYGRASVTDPPPGACPWKRPAASESSARASLLGSRMISMSCSKVHLRLVKKFPGHPPAGAIVPSAAPGVAESVIKQAPLAAASRQRPARSIGGGCGGRGGGGGEAAACSLGGVASCDVLVHAPTAANDRSRPAAIALRLFRPLHMDVHHAKGRSRTRGWVAPKCIRSHLVFYTRDCAMADDRPISPGANDYCRRRPSIGPRCYGHGTAI